MFRPPTVYGPFIADDRVMQRFIRAAHQGQPPTIHGDRSARMDVTYVEDCADGIVARALNPTARGEAFNVSRPTHSLSDLVAILRKHYPDLRVEHRRRPDHVPLRGALDVGKAHRLLGYSPKVNLEERVARYVAHM